MKGIRVIFMISMLIALISIGVVIFVALSESGINIGETSLKELWENEDTRVIFFMPIVLIIVGVSLIPFYRILFPMKIKNGVMTQAKVLEVRDTGVTVNDNPQVGMKLELRTQEGIRLEVEAKTIVSRLSVANVQPGIMANIIYDPLKPQRLVVESFEAREQAGPSDEGSEDRSASATERMLELNDLRARNLISEEEYQAKRSEILNNI